MLFHEIYGSYYQTIARAIRLAIDGRLDEKTLRRISDETAFSETALTVIPACKEQRWQLFDRNWNTPIRHVPTLPLSDLQRRWLKTITLDPRFQLFGIEVGGLDDVEPLFTQEDICVFDRYGDGDPYTDPTYIAIFRTVLTAIRRNRQLAIEYVSRKGISRSIVCRPRLLEYSEKDDKFRIIVRNGDVGSINLQRITHCTLLEKPTQNTVDRRKAPRATVMFDLVDERNALERAMLHFAHFQKTAERTDENSYRITLQYNVADETELLIRILSFGPYLKVVSPASFIEQIRDRLEAQRKLWE